MRDLLGYDPESLRATLGTLNAVRGSVLDDARRLAQQNRLLAVKYLRCVVKEAQFDDVSQFIDDVLLGGGDPALWGVRDHLVIVDLPLSTLLAKSTKELVDLLRPVPGKKWWRIIPDAAAWSWSSFCGAPAVIVGDAPYWWKSPTGFKSLTGSTAPMEPITEAVLYVAFRQWIASRIAWEIRMSAPPTTIAQLKDNFGVDQLSADGERILAAVLEDVRDPPADTTRAPGFRRPA